ncbi:MAG: ribosome silencing factor [Puniceicoccales bacterium]|nr:ribosome silencing factor [Puniceicoccales bacterium]
MAKDFPEALASCYQIIVDKKCANSKVFDIRGVSNIADYVILTTCTSEAHLRAIGNELYQTFKHSHGQLCRVDYLPLSGWLVFDAFDVILHAFTESMRQKYNLDLLFGKFNALNLNSILMLDVHEKNASLQSNHHG